MTEAGLPRTRAAEAVARATGSTESEPAWSLAMPAATVMRFGL